MDFAPAYMMDYSLLASIVKEKLTPNGRIQALIRLVKTEVLKWTQAKNIEEVPEALVKIVAKEAVQLVVSDIKHKVEAIWLWLSVHAMYKYWWIHKYFPDTAWLELFSESLPSACAWLVCMYFSRLFFIWLVWPAIRYDQKRRLIEKWFHERFLREEAELKVQIARWEELLRQTQEAQNWNWDKL